MVLPCLTYFLHECAHWLAYLFYGIDARLDINTIRLPQQIELTSTQQFIIYGSGVFFSLSQGIIGYGIAFKKEVYFGGSLLLSAAVFRLTFAVVTLVLRYVCARIYKCAWCWCICVCAV